MNKPTITGVPRDDQRRRYDERREREIPSRGLGPVIIKSVQLDWTARGRLRRRDRVADLEAVRAALLEAGIPVPPLST